MLLPSSAPTWSFPRRVALVAVTAVLLALGWVLADVVVLVFGSIVFAVVLRAMAAALERGARVPPRWSVVVTVLVLLAGLAATGWLVGDALGGQLADLRAQLPRAWAATTRWLETVPAGRQALEALREAWRDGAIPAPRLAGLAGTMLGAIGSTVLMLIVAIYLAASPHTYRDGLLALVPPAHRPRAARAVDAAGEGLLRWLKGQALSMLFIGVTTAVGLWLLDVPLALTLGLISGLLAFVPFYGAIAGGVLSVLMGFVAGPQTALWVALLYLAVQQVEELLLLPLVQRWAVALPPVLGLVAALVFGVLFGPVGVVFATPLMVVAMIAVRVIYLEGVLHRHAGTPVT